VDVPNQLHSHYRLLLGLNSPWEVADVNLQLESSRVVIRVVNDTKKACCPKCGESCRIKDRAPQRQWRHLDTMNFETIIQSCTPRSNCPGCGVKTVTVPWADKSSRFTLMFEGFVVEVIMERAVERGLEQRDISEVERVGFDEKSFLRGHNYITLLNDLDKGRVLDVVPERTEAACRELIMKTLPTPWSRFKIEAAAMDMWPAFTKAASDLLEEAEIVFDRFHVSKHLGEAVDQVRRAEHKQLLAQGDRSLVGTRYSLLRSENTRTEKHEGILKQLCGRNLKTAKAWAIKESAWAVRSRLKPVVKVARMIKRHLDGLLSYFRHRVTNAVSEGLNSKIQSLKASARGFRNFENYRTRILFFCGKLALSPKTAH